MRRNAIETIMGGVVLVVAFMFLTTAYSIHASGPSGAGYRLSSEFFSVGTLREKADVKLGGIRIGRVESVRLDPITYFAVVEMQISSEVLLPADSIASISAGGLFSDAYVSFKRGTATETLNPGGRVQRADSPVDLVDSIGRKIFGQVN
ncbi:MAG: MlaD family protein [Pseudomonadota bacterium]